MLILPWLIVYLPFDREEGETYNYRKDHVSIFRFDNAADPHAKSLRTFPHHKNIEDRYIGEAHQTELFSVITEIEEIYISGERG